jgi:hypothetical protein
MPMLVPMLVLVLPVDWLRSATVVMAVMLLPHSVAMVAV